MEIYKDKLGKIHVNIDKKRNWIFFQREKEKPTDEPVFFGMQLSLLKEILSKVD